MNKRVKAVCTIVVLIGMMGLAACGKKEQEQTGTEQAKESVKVKESAKETEKVAETTGGVEVETSGEQASGVTFGTIKSGMSAADLIDVDITSGEFKMELDGNVYEWPILYDELYSDGIEFPEDDMGIFQDLLDSRSSKVTGYAYTDKGFEVYIGLKPVDDEWNAEDVIEELRNWVVYDLRFRIVHYNNLDESYPTLTLPGNITWGSSIDDCIAAWGEPSDDLVYDEDSYGNAKYHYITWDFPLEDSDGRYDNLSISVEAYESAGVVSVIIQAK